MLPGYGTAITLVLAGLKGLEIQGQAAARLNEPGASPELYALARRERFAAFINLGLGIIPLGKAGNTLADLIAELARGGMLGIAKAEANDPFARMFHELDVISNEAMGTGRDSSAITGMSPAERQELYERLREGASPARAQTEDG
jgi:hypothetical protein